MRVSLGAAFGLSVLAGAAGIYGKLLFDRHADATAHRVVAHALTPDIAVTEQLKLDNVAGMHAQRFATLIDLRPDGEAPDQPPSDQVRIAASRAGLFFAYVPVPHGDIPNTTVEALARALATTPKPALLYCRTGRRAARTWALVEARRPGGLDAGAIEHAVKEAGQNVEDLDATIGAHVAERAQVGR